MADEIQDFEFEHAASPEPERGDERSANEHPGRNQWAAGC
jgi:hypothetical protein